MSMGFSLENHDWVEITGNVVLLAVYSGNFCYNFEYKATIFI